MNGLPPRAKLVIVITFVKIIIIIIIIIIILLQVSIILPSLMLLSVFFDHFLAVHRFLIVQRHVVVSPASANVK